MLLRRQDSTTVFLALTGDWGCQSSAHRSFVYFCLGLFVVIGRREKMKGISSILSCSSFTFYVLFQHINLLVFSLEWKHTLFYLESLLLIFPNFFHQLRRQFSNSNRDLLAALNQKALGSSVALTIILNFSVKCLKLESRDFLILFSQIK